MSDDLENLLQGFRPAGPPARLREAILRLEIQRTGRTGRWRVQAFRGAVAATLLVSFSLFYAAGRLDQDSAAGIGRGPLHWTAEAQEAADLIGPGPAGRQYIALCLMSGAGRAAQHPFTPGADR